MVLASIAARGLPLSPYSWESSAALQRILFTDLRMLVMNGGRERTDEEYASLLSATGFKINRISLTSYGVNVIEGIKA